jgi:hypothetical protein
MNMNKTTITLEIKWAPGPQHLVDDPALWHWPVLLDLDDYDNVRVVVSTTEWAQPPDATMYDCPECGRKYESPVVFCEADDCPSVAEIGEAVGFGEKEWQRIWGLSSHETRAKLVHAYNQRKGKK